MRDMVPRERRSIRDIPVPANHRRVPQAYQEEEQAYTEDETMADTAYTPPRGPRMRRSRRRPWIFIAIAVVALCAVAGLLLSTLFSGVTVTVYQKTAVADTPQSLTLKPNPATGELGYKTVTATRTGTTTAPATGSQEVSRSASGVITVYNETSSGQRLINNTRFEAPDGKIYRIHDSVTVPGATGTGSSLKPGSVSVTAYADSPGDTYNRGKTHYTIPGFKDDPRYSKFYAEGEAMSGGFVGTEPSVAPSDLSKATEILKQGLSEAAQSMLASQVPAGYVILPGTLQATFSDLLQTPGSGNTAQISQSATMTGAIVSADALASAIAASGVSGYQGEPVSFLDISQLHVAAASSTQPGTGNIELSLSGSPTLIWQYDATAFKKALAGKNKEALQDVIKEFQPAIVRAEAKIIPFWKSGFSTNPDDITLVSKPSEQ